MPLGPKESSDGELPRGGGGIAIISTPSSFPTEAIEAEWSEEGAVATTEGIAVDFFRGIDHVVCSSSNNNSSSSSSSMSNNISSSTRINNKNRIVRFSR